MRSALIVEGAGAVVGGATSSSSNTVFIESGAGIEEGARTGLANLVTGALFLAAMFVSPLASIVPTEVAAAALVVVGALMASQLRHIELTEFSIALPVVLTVTVMPFSYSIANGIGVGFIAWVVMRTAAGKVREVSPLLWVVAAGFALYFARTRWSPCWACRRNPYRWRYSMTMDMATDQFRDAPIFDADQHMYETADALVKFLPERYARAVQYAQFGRHTRIVINNRVSDFIPNPTFERVAAPGAHEKFFAGENTEGLTLREMQGLAIEAPAATRNPADRVAELDRQGCAKR